LKKSLHLKERMIKNVCLISSLASIFFMTGITVILFKEGLPLFKGVSLSEFFLGKSWYPTFDPPDFGMLPLFVGSLWITFGAIMIAAPFGISVAIFISEFTSPKMQHFSKSIIELLTGIPSVIFGFLGLVFLGPWLKNILNLPVGLNSLTASILLALMAIPTISSLSEEALFSVSKDYKEASYALGATKWETISKIVVPAAFPGINTAIFLGIGRVIGETMTVLMVAGGAAIIPHSFLQPARPITANIALEMGETVVGSDHYHALFALACVLFILNLILNLTANYLFVKKRRSL